MIGPDYLKYFPKSSCYPNQEDAMKRIHSAIFRQEVVLFEGACGTGKTLSALSPALQAGDVLDKTVFIATNVHQQMVQFIDEARQIKQFHDIKVVVFKGKKSMCPLQLGYDECEAKRENTFELIDIENETRLKRAEMKAAMDNYKKSSDAVYVELRDQLDAELKKLEDKAHALRDRCCNELYEVLRLDNEKFKEWLFETVRDPDEVNQYAYENGMCGYELLKKELKSADLVIGNFHHLLDGDIFSTMLRWLEKEAEDIIIILDEAHNIESAARSHSSITLTEHTIERALSELEANSMDEAFQGLDIQDIDGIISILLEVLKETYNSRFRFGEKERVGENWYDLRISDPFDRGDIVKARFLRNAKEADYGEKSDIQRLLGMASDIGAALDEKYREQYKEGKSAILKRSHIWHVAEFLSFYLEHSDGQEHYPILNVRRDNRNEVYGRLELFTCIPQNVTAPLFRSVHSAILMSATLKPFDMIKTTLGIERDTCELSYGLTFPAERRLTIAAAVQPQFARSRDEPGNLEDVFGVMRDSIENSPGNVVIFFQSSFEARRYFRMLEESLDIPIFLDEVGISAQEVRREFFRVGEAGGKAVLLTYLWGTLSEGVDFRDGRCRVAIIVGVGYPALNDRMHAVESAYDHEFGFGMGWEYAVQIPTIRKIRQAMGRVVRSPTDYGVRILLDGRFLTDSQRRWPKYSVFGFFPEEEKPEFVDVEPAKVKYSLLNFFQDIEDSQ